MDKKINANTSLKVLYLEDTPRDAEIIRELILDSGYNLEMEIAEVKEAYETFLRTRNYDIILSDFKLPGFDAFGALQLRNEICPSVPFICVSGSIGEETAIELLRLGADDYVLKDRPERLPFSIQSALDDAKKRDEHLKAEELLRESEEKYRLLFDCNPHSMWVYDLDNLNFLLVNDAAIIKYGYTREEFMKMNLKDIRPVEDVDKLLDDVKTSSDEISFSGEWRHKNKKGDIFLVEIISHSIILNQKNARLVLANDITERKSAEEALRESELRFRSVWEKSTDGMRITNEEGIVVLVNDAYCKIVEKPHEEIEGKPMSIVYEEAKRTDVLRKHQERFRSRSIPAHLERELILWNGKRIFLELSNTFLENPHQPTLSLSVFKDISERKRAEDELRLRETYLSAIIENQPGLVWLKNTEGRFLAANNAFALSCGKQSAKEMLGKTDNDLWPPELAGKYRKDDEQVMQNVKPISFEELIIDKGEEKWFETFKTPVIDLNGKIIGTTGFAKDISERKLAEEKLRILSLRQQAILASVPDIIMEVDNNKIYTWANAAGLEFFGDDVIGKNASFYFEGDQETYNTVKPLFNGSENIIYVESWQRRKNGEKRLLAWWCKVLKDEKGKVTGALSSAQDITEHKLAEETLKKSEESYRFIVESTKAVIYHLKYSTMKYDYINPAIEKLTGYTPEEINEIGFKKIVVKISRYHVENFNIDLIVADREQGNTPEWRADYQVRTKDGRLIWLSDHSYPWLDESGNLIGGIGILEDITERKLAEKILTESEERFRAVSEYSFNSICIVNEAGKIIWANEAMFKMSGYTNEQIYTADSFANFIAPESVEFVIPNFMNFVRGEKYEHHYEFYFIRSDGEKRLCEKYMTHFQNAKGSRNLVISMMDITERRQAEKEVIKLSYAVQQSPVSVVITNLKGEIEYVNNKFCELTGYTKEEAIGKNPAILKSGHHSKSFYEELWTTILSGNIWKGEIVNKKKNGDIYWESESISPLVNKEGVITHFVAMKEDITEKVKNIAELFEAKEKAETASKLKDAFINNISHEIRTPLNGITGLSNLIKENYAQYMVEDDESLFTGIDVSAQRIIRTVDMILNYSRLQSGEFTVIPKQINLFEICEHIIKQNKEAAEVKSLKLLFDNRCNGTKITGDEYTITQIVSNLLDNAIKYTNKGTIEIALFPDTDGGVTFEIKDTGIGIAAEYLEHLFEPYMQEDMGYGRSYEGVGLGLALTKKFVELNNAVLSVESIKGEGTTFRIKFNKGRIPQKSEIDLVKKAEPVNTTVTKKEIVILMVEDDPVNQNVMKRVLRKQFKLFFADSAEEAYGVLKKNEIDLILMDISIRGNKDGLELTKELKGTKKYAHIPVIAVTAHAGNEAQRNALAAGCDEYLAKPFSIDRLLEKICKFVKEEK